MEFSWVSLRQGGNIKRSFTLSIPWIMKTCLRLVLAERKDRLDFLNIKIQKLAKGNDYLNGNVKNSG